MLVCEGRRENWVSAMGVEVFSDMMAVLWQHPVLTGVVLVLFTPPFFPIVKFFSPLLISTALFMIAFFTMGGPQSSSSTVEENWEFRRAADVKVWEDNSVMRTRSRRADGSWMASLHAVAESVSSWVETKLQNENWKGSSLNDDNVSILQEVSWPKVDDASPPLPFTNSKTEEGLGEDEPPKESTADSKQSTADPKQSTVASKQSTVRHEALVALQIPNQTDSKPSIVSPSVDLGESSRRMVRRDSINASSGLSELDTPVAASSTTEKLSQIEKLGELIEEKEQHPKKPLVLKETITALVEAVKEKLDGFTHSPPRPSSPLFKPEEAVVKSKSTNGHESSSSGDEELLSDSDSDSEFEIFPPVDPAKIKLHPPVKLDIPQLEKKLGMSLSQRTSRASTPPKGEITEAL